MTRNRTAVYVDGFNVYFAIRHTPYRWLNLSHLVSLLVPSSELVALRYFTARIQARGDPEQPQRQDIYLRALRTMPRTSIHFGRFLMSQVRMPYVAPSPHGPKTALVWKTEEKGSDVNLATYLLSDGFRGLYEQAVVISNDSDLVEPIRMTHEELGLPVTVLNPTPHFSRSLKVASTDYRPVSERSLKAAQFPTTLKDDAGEFHRPPGWEHAKSKPPVG